MAKALTTFSYYENENEKFVKEGDEVSAPTNLLEAWAKSGLVTSSTKPKAKKAKA